MDNFILCYQIVLCPRGVILQTTNLNCDNVIDLCLAHKFEQILLEVAAGSIDAAHDLQRRSVLRHFEVIIAQLFDQGVMAGVSGGAFCSKLFGENDRQGPAAATGVSEASDQGNPQRGTMTCRPFRASESGSA